METDIIKDFYTMDEIRHPSHYNRNGVEAKDVIDLVFKFFGGSIDAREGWLISNIIKYLLRHKFKKDPQKDLEKAKEYLDWMIEAIESQEDDGSE